jgi:hypothetical protein
MGIERVTAAALACALLCTGCVTTLADAGAFASNVRLADGLIFTYTTRPLTTNFDETPVSEPYEKGGDEVWQVQYRGLRILSGDNGIGSLARDARLKDAYYADVRTLSILNLVFLWRVQVYGKRDLSGAPTP